MDGGPRVKSNAKSQKAFRPDEKLTEIQPLPPEVVAQIKSSSAITSLTAVVLGLVQNSFDAGSTKVTIDVDFLRGGCTVEDDGVGILPSEFRDTGGLGKMYHTSKYARSSSTYGTNGSFLASLSALCLLSITSKHYQHHSTNSLIAHQAKTFSRLCPAPSSHGLDNRDHGSRVKVRDLFGNMAVRVKQRGLLAEDQAELGRLWEELKNSLTAFVVAFGSPLSIQLREHTLSKQLAFHGLMTNEAPTRDTANASLLSSKHRYALTRLYQAEKITSKSPGSWIPASASSKTITVKGMICLNPAPNKAVQYLSLGIRPLIKHGGNIFYDRINRLFSQSRFGAVEEDSLTEEEAARRLGDGRFKREGLTKKQTFAEKGVDRWPMFVLKIEFRERSGTSDDLLRSEASISSVVQVLDALVTSWLSAHHFRPRPVTINPKEAVVRHSEGDCRANSHSAEMDETIESLSEARSNTACTSRQGTPIRSSTTLRPYTGVATINSLSRIKSSHKTDFNRSTGKDARLDSAPNMTKESDNRYISSRSSPKKPLIFVEPFPENGTLPRSNEIEVNHRVDPRATSGPSSTNTNNFQHRKDVAEDTAVDWVDPITKQVHRLNARTGMRMANAGTTRPASDATADESQLVAQHGHRISLASRGRQKASANSSSTNTIWIDGLLQGWDNPIYMNREQPITQTSLDLPLFNKTSTTGQSQTSRAIELAFSEISHLNASKISKSALKNARVIGQADEKFILARLSGTDTNAQSLLVAIDQHAADERCKVEKLLQDLCSPPEATDQPPSTQTGLQASIRTVTLEKALKFSIPSQETNLFRRNAVLFAHWGMLYDIEDPQGLVIRALPPVIAERCRLDPKLLISLLRTEIWRREEAGITFHPGNQAEKGESWIKRIATCPPGLLDMVNSRACRSAIMFNDALTVEQCEELVRDLAQCALPFQCAHGRPSMVPLVELGHGGEGGLGIVGDGGEEESYAGAFRRWMA